MVHPVVERRRRERDARLREAAEWAAGLPRRLRVHAVVIIGSYARGDFNKWSDLDVLVVADNLPDHPLARLALLAEDAPPGLQPIGWTSGELVERRRRKDPIAVEADGVGEAVYGELPPPG